jgi:hypothetical protein
MWLTGIFSSVSEKLNAFACPVIRRLPEREDEGTKLKRNTGIQSAQNGIPEHNCMLQ